MFCDRMDVEKPQMVPLLVFGHCETFFLKFLSLQKVPPSVSSIFYNRMGVQMSQRVPLSVFRHCETFRNFVFSRKGPLFNCDKNVENFGSVPPFSAPRARASGPGATRSIFLVFWFSSTVNWHLEVLLLFLSLGYGADLGRSRLVFNLTQRL